MANGIDDLLDEVESKYFKILEKTNEPRSLSLQIPGPCCLSYFQGKLKTVYQVDDSILKLSCY